MTDEQDLEACNRIQRFCLWRLIKIFQNISSFPGFTCLHRVFGKNFSELAVYHPFHCIVLSQRNHYAISYSFLLCSIILLPFHPTQKCTRLVTFFGFFFFSFFFSLVVKYSFLTKVAEPRGHKTWIRKQIE